MGINRRSLTKALAVAPLVSLFSKGARAEKSEIILPLRSAESGEFHQRVTCSYPRTMSFDEFTKASCGWTNPPAISQMDREFYKNGHILEIRRHIRPSSVVWSYAFKSRQAFIAWSEEAERRKLYFSDRVAPGFRYRFEYKDAGGKFMAARPLCEGSLERHPLELATVERRHLSEVIGSIFKWT